MTTSATPDIEMPFRALFDAAPAPLLVLAPPDWTIVAVNQARLEVTGTTRDGQIGRSLFDLFPDDPEDPEADGVRNLTASFERVVATRAADIMTVQRYAVRGPDGRFVQRWWAPVNSPVLGEDGEVRFIIHRVDEVTELVQLRGEAEAKDRFATEQQAIIDRLRATDGALRQSEERSRRIVEGVKDYSVFVTDPEGRIVDWAPGAEAIFGWKADEIVGRNAALLFTPEDVAAGVPARELATAREKGCANDERWHVGKDGALFFADGSVRPLHDDRGQVSGFIKIARNETERRAVEARLRASEEFNRRILASSADCIKVLDLDARLEFMSEGGMCVMEVDDFGAIEGACWPDFWAGEQHAQALAAVAEAKAGRTGRFQGLAPTMKGTPRWWDVIVTSISGPEGVPEKLLSISRDVTATKEAELRLRELNETLEERVAERTADLVHAQAALRQSQKMEAMGQFTGGVAHDFNNLLTPIIGALDMLQRRSGGSERERRLVNGAAQSAERAKTLVQRLLAFARRQPLQAEAVDVATLVRNMADLVASTIGPQINVVVDIAGELPAAHADANQLEMAILNLSVNARDAMPDKGTLRLSADLQSCGRGHPAGLKPGDYVRLCVTDTGTGMDEATIARAVEPFFSTKGIGKGTGLGLSMVHGLASQLGGGLTLSSTPGLGTNATLWLPLADATVAKAEAPPEAARRAVGAGTVLLVDDEELVRASTADMLVQLGYHVAEAASGEQALLLIDEGLRPDVLVTDHLMPGMTGTELAVLFRQRAPRSPVLLISGYAEDEGVDAGLARLTKPFRQDDLAASLSVLDGAA